MDKTPVEWLKQADYDMEAAEFLLSGQHCLQAIFYCHLSVEKALKGLYQAGLGREQPKTHDPIWLLNSLQVRPPERLGRLLVRLNETNVETRYPDNLDEAISELTPQAAAGLIGGAKEILQWIREKY
jgi:HEPN domain-containing protein